MESTWKVLMYNIMYDYACGDFITYFIKKPKRSIDSFSAQKIAKFGQIEILITLILSLHVM